MNLYNDIDKNAAAWTQQLITNKLIPDGVMVCKSITDIQPHELDGFTQAHFFNGISGWARALALAGWPATRPIWCASLPCQPFSCAGKGEGVNDERHLWPVFFQLVKACKPVVIVGEQVEAAIGHGWLDGVFADLEGEGYTCGAVIVGAHSVKSPHRRQRIYWVARRLADTNSGLLRTSDATGADSGSTATDAHPGPGHDGMANTSSVRFNELSQREFGGTQEEGRLQQPEGTCSTGCGADSTLGDTNSAGCETFGNVASGTGQGPGKPESTGASGGRVEDSRCTKWSEDAGARGENGKGTSVDHSRSSETGSMAHTQHGLREQRDTGIRTVPEFDTDGRLGNSQQPGLEGHAGDVRNGSEPGRVSETSAGSVAQTSGTGNFWGNTWHPCRDNKWRRIPTTADAQPVLQCLVAGLHNTVDDIGLASLGFPLSKTIPNRVALLKGYGNAIVPQVAAEFVKVVMEII